MTQILKTFSIGADPEIFVRSTETMEFISAHNLIKGTKEKPFKISKGAIQVDGVALEFNIKPAKDVGTFIGNIMAMKNVLKNEIQRKNKHYQLCIAPTATFDKLYFDTLPDVARALGCEPDYNAWTLEENKKPETNKPMRTASGHVHIGWLEEDDMPVVDLHSTDWMSLCSSVVKQLDVALLIPSLLFDKDKVRRTLYGKPGAFRPKPYGVEYRPLSNAWINNNDTMEWVFKTTQRALNDLYVNNNYFDLIPNIRQQLDNFTNPGFVDEYQIKQLIHRWPGIFTLPNNMKAA